MAAISASHCNRPGIIPTLRNFAARYYTESDAPLYYLLLVYRDALIATMPYKSLPPEQQVRFDSMITGFNPADMYAVDHIRLARPADFSRCLHGGLANSPSHKELVSPKVAGPAASLTNPALDRILNFCTESGLLVIIHNDIDMPFSRPGVNEPVYLAQMKDLLRRHPKTPIIWAHTGLGRIVRPFRVQGDAIERSPMHIRILEGILSDRDLDHVYFDISWEEVAKYIVASPETVKVTADMINRHPKRFLFGTD